MVGIYSEFDLDNVRAWDGLQDSIGRVANISQNASEKIRTKSSFVQGRGFV